MNEPIKAVLVDVAGVERWCERVIAHECGVKAVPGYAYLCAYRDFVTGEYYAQARCRVIRDGLVRVECVEVAEDE